MEQQLDKIIEDLEANKITKRLALDTIISIIEYSDDEQVRLQCLDMVSKINEKKEILYKFLENLLISDNSVKIRQLAIELIGNLYLDKALPLMEWALDHECSVECIQEVINNLVKINSDNAKSLLINEIEKITNNEYILKDKGFTNKSFKKDYKELFKNQPKTSFGIKELAELFLNYRIIIALKEKFYSVYYELRQGLITTLDLTDVEYEVRGWKAEFKNNIKHLSEITGLPYLRHLKYLFLSNNQITSLKELIALPSLTHLYIINNRIEDVINIEYIKQMKALKFIDISDNKLVLKINIEEFRHELEIKLDKEDFEKANKIFEAIGLNTKIKWYRLRNQFDWKNIKVCLDYTKGYGYIIELEKITDEENKEKVLEILKQKLQELNIKLTPKQEFENKFKHYELNWRQLTSE